MHRRDFLKTTAAFAAATTAQGRPVRAAPPEAISLKSARAALVSRQDLTTEQKQLIVDTARNLMEEVYVHRTMKLAQYGIDPVPQLRALRSRVQQLSDLRFHREMRRIFVQLRDRHTHYKSGRPDQAYTLPFAAARALDDGRWGYFVTRSRNPSIPVGSKIETWNGGELDRVVEELAEDVGAGNYPSRLAVSRRYLARRLMSMFDPPVENDVRLEIIDPSGARKEISLEWKVEQVRRKLEVPAGRVLDLGIDETHFLTSEPSDDDWLWSSTIRVGGKEYGYLRIKTFHLEDDRYKNDRYMKDVIERLKSIPQTGLVIDIRHNGGGTIQVGERLLQLFYQSRDRIEPHTFRSRASSTMAEFAPSSSEWHRTIVQGMTFGSELAADFRLTSVEAANDKGNKYPGPVVLLVDGITYSTADMFASGFQSHGLGKVVGIDENVGAGGANNLKTYADLRERLPKEDTRFPPLPAGVDFGFSLRQAIRRGPRYNGLILEDAGIRIDHRHRLTKRDVLSAPPGPDLLEAACSHLAT